MVSLGVLDQSENDHSIVAGSLEALTDEGSAGIRPLPRQPGERRETFPEKSFAMVGRASARSVSFWYLFCLCICFCIWGRFCHRYT